MGATSDNYEIVTGGTTYTIASDYVNPFGGETAHFQIVKAVYGTGDSVTNISSDTPLPVQAFGAWSRYDYLASSGYYSLAVNVTGFTGNAVQVEGVSGGALVGVTVGTVAVSSSNLDIRALYGGTLGDGTLGDEDYVKVQGICGGYPVGITVSSALPVSITSLTGFGVWGISGATALGVTFGTVDIRGLTAVSDTITVYGGGTAGTVSVGLFGFNGETAESLFSENNALNVNVKYGTGVTVSAADLDIRAIDYTTDTITVVGQGDSDDDSKSTVPTYITAVDKNGNLVRVGGSTGAGWSAGALNVYLVNNGITFTVSASATFDTLVGVTATYAGALPIQGSPNAGYPVWIAGSTSGGAITVTGSSGGFLPVEVSGFDTQTANIQGKVGEVKNNTDYLLAVKKALYSDKISVGAQDFSDEASIYNQIKTNVGDRLAAIQDTIVPANQPHSTQNALAVNVTKVKRVASFMSRTGFVGNTPVNLTSYNGASGFTCEMGVRIKVSRVPSGANSSQNEIMCVISEADAAVYGASNVGASYVMYHGDEMFFEVDNIDKIKVFYPALSASNAPSNTSSGLTFSFYAS
jgi:hypothetical protein